MEVSPWIERWAHLIVRGPVLDVACGEGRHARYFLGRGLDVVAIDRTAQVIPGARFVQADLENANAWPLPGERFEAVIVTNYLYRPLFSVLCDALAPGGVLLSETFMLGNERFGRPSNPEFLLRPGELLQAFASLDVKGFEEGEVARPKPAMIQRLCAVRAGNR